MTLRAIITQHVLFLPKAQTAILQKDVEAEILFQPEEQKEEKGEETKPMLNYDNIKSSFSY